MGVVVEETLLTVKEVADQLRFGEETVRRLLRTGALKGMIVSDRGGWRIAPEEVRRFVRDNQGKRPPAIERVRRALEKMASAHGTDVYGLVADAGYVPPKDTTKEEESE